MPLCIEVVALKVIYLQNLLAMICRLCKMYITSYVIFESLKDVST